MAGSGTDHPHHGTPRDDPYFYEWFREYDGHPDRKYDGRIDMTGMFIAWQAGRRPLLYEIDRLREALREVEKPHDDFWSADALEELHELEKELRRVREIARAALGGDDEQ